MGVALLGSSGPASGVDDSNNCLAIYAGVPLGPSSLPCLAEEFRIRHQLAMTANGKKLLDCCALIRTIRCLPAFAVVQQQSGAYLLRLSGLMVRCMAGHRPNSEALTNRDEVLTA